MVELTLEDIKQQLQQMDPYEFEKLVAKVWELQGYQTTVSKGSGDRGIDIKAIKETPFEQKVLIQAKCYSDGNKIGSQKVRSYATLHQQEPDADSVVIVSTSGFTKQAEEIARDLNVKTISGEKFAATVKQHISDLNEFEIGYREISPFTSRRKLNASDSSGVSDMRSKLPQYISALYELAPEYEVFQWPVDQLGKAWISNQEYLYCHLNPGGQIGDIQSILIQYAVTTREEPVVKPKILVMFGKGTGYDDVKDKFDDLENQFNCTVEQQQQLPGTCVIFEILRGDYDTNTIVDIFQYVLEEMFDAGLEEISEIKYDSTTSGVTSACSGCGRIADEDAAFCDGCGANLSEGRIDLV